MLCEASILERIQPIQDPEMPISIVDLGLIETIRVERDDGTARVVIEIVPTFVGCPALDMIRDDVVQAVGAMEGVSTVDVHFVHAPPWSVDRITPAGRASLAAHGVTVPAPGAPSSGTDASNGADIVTLGVSALACPFCDSRETQIESPFGPTRCRMVFYCNACKNTFEHLKRV
jgi:ring-1,2-phenylacetyl-CoA epoxidase subunit PaaD